MKCYYDTEFLEDGKTIELISIGMVAEDGRELYCVNEAIETDEKLHERICKHNWLMANVVRHLPLMVYPRTGPAFEEPGPPNVHPRKVGRFRLDMGDNRIMPMRMIRNAVRDFLLGGHGGDFREPELWAWYGAYDHVALAQLFGRMIDLPKGIPMWTNDLRQEVHRLGNPRMPEQADGQHNALADARHVKTMHDHLLRSGKDHLHQETT